MAATREVPASLALVQRFVQSNHPGADTVLLAGSAARGTATASSDLDIVVLLAALPDGAWRETMMLALVDDALAPYGGRLDDGFRQQAPKNWRLPALGGAGQRSSASSRPPPPAATPT